MLRPQLILGACAGLAAGAAAWWAAGGSTAHQAKIEPLVERFARLRGPSVIHAASTGAAQTGAMPLFVLTTGPGAVAPPTLRLDGLSRSRGRAAALLSINDRPAEWLAVGDARDGVTLQSVSGSKVTVDTIYGPQEVALGEQIGGQAQAQALAQPPGQPVAPPPPAQASIIDRPPPGFRSPPAPASAPDHR